jgi:tetratricopeptide (TPR) repeat protein
VRAHLAHLLLAQDRVDEAVAMIDSSLALDAGGDPRFEVYWRTARAKALAHTSGDAVEAVRLAREAVEIVGRTGNLNLHAEALAMLGEVLEATGDRSSAAVVFEDARAMYERKGNPLRTDRMQETLDRLARTAAPG